jgi:hypothetical protein
MADKSRTVFQVDDDNQMKVEPSAIVLFIGNLS